MSIPKLISEHLQDNMEREYGESDVQLYKRRYLEKTFELKILVLQAYMDAQQNEGVDPSWDEAVNWALKTGAICEEEIEALAEAL